jgi:uncharacterized protein (TIRG00374 family)
MGSIEEKFSFPRIPTWIPAALGYVVSIASLIWVFRGVDYTQILRDITSLDWRYVTVAVVFDLAVYVCHGWRWKILLTPVGRVPFLRSVQAVYIGLFFNEVLPLRPGEVIRCYLLSYWSKVPLSLSFASAGIERIIDGVWLIAAFFFALKTTELDRVAVLPGSLVEGAQILGALILAGVGLLALIVFRKHRVRTAIEGHRWQATLDHLVDGLHSMGNSHTVLAASGASLLYLVLQVVPVWALLEGYGVEQSSPWVAAAVLIILRIGTVVPNAPGNVGSYNLICVLALSLFGVDKTTAAGVSVVMWSALTAPLLAGGLIAVLMSGLKHDEVRRRAHQAHERQAEEPQS